MLDLVKVPKIGVLFNTLTKLFSAHFKFNLAWVG